LECFLSWSIAVLVRLALSIVFQVSAVYRSTNATTGLACEFTESSTQATRWSSLITPPGTFRRSTGASNSTTTDSSWSGGGIPTVGSPSESGCTQPGAWGLLRRDWRPGAALYGVAAGWLPWFAFHARTEYFYHAVSFEPFLCLVLALCTGLIIGPAGESRLRRAGGAAIATAYLLAVAANFAYLYPVLTGSPISHSAWLARMWLSTWI
jgi:C-terminal four TMM region of protein-O-mannosyltransferase